jgi:hypothetical protein
VLGRQRQAQCVDAALGIGVAEGDGGGGIGLEALDIGPPQGVQLAEQLSIGMMNAGIDR